MISWVQACISTNHDVRIERNHIFWLINNTITSTVVVHCHVTILLQAGWGKEWHTYVCSYVYTFSKICLCDQNNIFQCYCVWFNNYAYKNLIL